MRAHSIAVVAFIALLLPTAASAHVNSPDVYYDGYAGPYHLLVTVRPPAVVPGVAQIEIRSAGDVDQIEILPMKMVGAPANLAPTPDTAERSATDPQLFHGKLWIMTRGSWKVQVRAKGKQGPAEMGVPLPAVSTHSATMQTGLAALLAVLGVVLLTGMVGIIGAANRDAGLEPGAEATPSQTKRAYWRMAAAAVLLIAIVIGGGYWWRAEASANARLNYRLPQAQASLQPGDVLRLQLDNPNTMESMFKPAMVARFKSLGIKLPDAFRLDDLVPDHGHLLHLFLVSTPDMKSFWHLHPEQAGVGEFTAKLPPIPAGRYQLYADIVHQTGFPETQVGVIELPAISGTALSGDDSGIADASMSNDVAQLPDGYRMVWERGSQPLQPEEAFWFRFRVENKEGKPASDLEPYMGMAGHAVFISDDGKIFAHVHPAGSVSMAAVGLAENQTPTQAASPMHEMAGMSGAPNDGEVSFPYGFPRAGDYRIFVQVKRGGRVETGVFNAHVGP
jgi:hypothetical protein